MRISKRDKSARVCRLILLAPLKFEKFPAIFVSDIVMLMQTIELPFFRLKKVSTLPGDNQQMNEQTAVGYF